MTQSDLAPKQASRILAVDDSPANLRLLMNLLTQHGYIVHPATSGQAALRFLQTTLPDLILLDAVMPGLDGYQLAERLKADERVQEVPVIFISAASQPLDKVRAFGCGAVDYIVKPFQAEEVLARITTHLALRNLQQAERQARVQAELANRAKTIFLASMSHELRTPLNAILGYAQILKRHEGLDERQLAGLNTIQQSGEHLLTLINDILDLSRIEAGRIELHPEAVALPAFLRVVTDIARIKADLKGLAFIFEAAPNLPRSVRIDPRRLRQILLNLLGNAVKFTDRGQVSLRVRPLSGDRAAARLRFEVEDSGPGIDPAQQELIFQPFEQVGEVARRFGGTGLGLAISRELVRQMDSDILVANRPEGGSRFWFDLEVPLAEASEVGPARAERIVTGYRGRRRRVLVADDAEANRAMLVELLRLVGFEITEAANGQEGLSQARASPPDLAIMDIMMPVMDGLEVTRRIRQTPGLEQLPVIVVSASALPEDRARSLAAGANAFMVKPIVPEQLLEEVGTQLGLSWEAKALPEPAPVPRLDEGILEVPPREEMEVLHHLAQAGNMRGIQERAEQLAALDERCRAFAERLRGLALGYQSKAILALIQRHLDGDGSGTDR